MAALGVAAIALALFALTFGFEKMPEGITRGFGAEAFPRLVLGTIVVLAVLLAIPPAGEPYARIAPMVYSTGASLLVFMALVPLVGMLPAMFLFLIGLGWLWGERRPWILLLTAGLLIACIWGVFVKGFGVLLPKGLLY